LAIGGKQTKWMLENLPSQLSLKQYDRVYIYGGTNDIFSQITVDKTISNVQKMVDLCISNGATPYVIIGYSPDTDMDYTKMPTTIYVRNKAEYIPMIEKYKEYQTKLPTNIKNAKFVGVFSIGVLSDGFHPSAAQHQKIAKIIIDGN
jgi:lysophospholipase L1-like esterase